MRTGTAYKWIHRVWYEGAPFGWLLLPLSGLYWLVSKLRRLIYRAGFLTTHRSPIPVIVVGNITVGGAGKTPLVLWLSKFLTERGLRPGIVLRGYGGHQVDSAVIAGPESDPAVVGDEALLLARNTSCPVFVSRNRSLAAQTLVREYDCNVILSDETNRPI